jgi:arylsulfatase A-like enzyme
MPLRAADREAEGLQHPWLQHEISHPLHGAPDDARKMQRMRAVYYGMVSEVDAALGRLFDHLRHEGLWDKTLIIFTSDHGEQLGDHWLLGKGGYFDQSYHVPLIIRDPDAQADGQRGRVVQAFTEHVDIMPTLLSHVDIGVPPQCDGAALQPFLRSAGPSRWRTHAHWTYDFRDASLDSAEQALGLTLHQCNLAVIRDERFKYVHFAGLAPLLFDLVKDPGEFVNLVDHDAYRSVALAYAQALISWRLRHEDQTLTHMMASPQGLVSRPAPRA